MDALLIRFATRLLDCTDTCHNGACYGTLYDGVLDATRGLNANGVATTIELPGTAATCDEIKLNSVDQCQSYNGGGQEASDAARCVETAAGTAASDATDLDECLEVTSLADATACDAVMKAGDSTAKVCTYATSTPPRRWSSAPCQAAGKVRQSPSWPRSWANLSLR